jgi:hypothetical protein
MSTKYIMPIAGGNKRDNTLVRVLTKRVSELKKL